MHRAAHSTIRIITPMKKVDHILVQKALDSQLTLEEFTEFQQKLRTEPELMQLYRDYAALDHSLREEFEGAVMIGKKTPVPKKRISYAPFVWTAAAAVAVLAVLFNYKTSNKQVVEEIVQVEGFPIKVNFSDDAVWKYSGNAKFLRNKGMMDSNSHISLQQGQVKVDLDESIRSIVQAPAEFQLINPQHVILESGRAVFHNDQKDSQLIVETPRMKAVDLGTVFGVVSDKLTGDEVHVAKGKVEMKLNGEKHGKMINQGEAMKMSSSTTLVSVGMQLPVNEQKEFTILAQNRFNTVEDVKKINVKKGIITWRNGAMDGVGYEAFIPLKSSDTSHTYLITLETADSAKGDFHTDGWAGLSLYREGKEIVFFGDTFGSFNTWGLDVKQDLGPIQPEQLKSNARTVTLRYEVATGEVSLHEGGIPLSAPFCKGNIPSHLGVDEIRIGASINAALAVKSFTVRVGM